MSARAREADKVVQAWVELKSGDPEALSALGVARLHLPAARGLAGLRRVRLFELSGALPGSGEIEERLHRSTQFFNPVKERCTVRSAPAEAAPLEEGEEAVLVFERGGERRPAAERWWLHETGARIEVREGVAWLVRWEGPGRPERMADLVELRDRRHGLLCNPHAQEWRPAGGEIPLPWLGPEDGKRAARGGRS